jgi:hypothetical protein
MTLTIDIVKTVCKTQDKIPVIDDPRPKMTMHQIRAIGPDAPSQPLMESSYLPTDIRKIVSAYNRLLAETVCIANHADALVAERSDVYRLRSAFVVENSIKAVDKKLTAFVQRLASTETETMSMTLKDLFEYVRERTEAMRVSCHMILTYRVLRVKGLILSQIRAD